MQRTVYDSGATQLTPKQADSLAASLRVTYPADRFELTSVPYTATTARGGRRRLVRVVVQRKRPS